MPPKTTAPTQITSAMPTTHLGILNVELTAVVIELPCAELPIPNEAIRVNIANITARNEPSFLFLRPYLSVYIGPPHISPFSLTVLYLPASAHSAYLVDIPKAAEIHIHTRAPGPPSTIAVATPTILPVPTVAASAVIKAENGEMSPSPSFCLDSLLKSFLSEEPRFFQGINFNLIVKKIPVPTRNNSITGPQTKSFMLLTI